MKKIIEYCLITLSTFVFLSSVVVHAADFSLTKIGTMDTAGSKYSEWWYTQTSPLLTGTAEPNSSVSVRVNNDTNTFTADSQGNWSYQMNAGQGDYEIDMSQGANGYQFTLHLGQAFPGGSNTTTTTQSANPVPTTGYEQLVGITFGLGVILLGTYMYMWGDSSKNVRFRRREIEE